MTVHIIPTLSDNYTYALENGSCIILVDCGEAEPVISFLKHKNLLPHYILCTHHHADHIDGLSGLIEHFPDLQIYGPEKDRHRMPLANNFLKDDDKFELCGVRITSIETKGHTENHLCFYLPDNGILFSGDSLFSMGCGRLLEGSAEEMFNSLQKLKTLPDQTQVFCGHEYTLKNAEFCLTQDPFNADLLERLQAARELRSRNLPTIPVLLGQEKRTNAFLKASSLENFTQLRKLRDQF